MNEPTVNVTDVENEQEAAADARLAKYQEASTLPLLTAGFLYVAAFVTSLSGNPDTFTSVVLLATWAIFILDYVIQLWLAPVKWKFVAKNVPYLFALLFPPLRVLLLLVITYRLFMNKNSSLKDRIGLAAGFAMMVIVVVGALVTLYFESSDPHANIKTYGEALWWATVTATTVGYGDFVPVTVMGRFTGVLVFSIGLAVIAVLTATIVGVFTDSARKEKRERKRAAAQTKKHKGSKRSKGSKGKPKPADITDVIQKLDEINSRLIRLERDARGEHGAASPKLSAPRRTVLATEDREAQHSDPDHSRSSRAEAQVAEPNGGPQAATGAKASGEVPEDDSGSKSENPDVEDSKGDAD